MNARLALLLLGLGATSLFVRAAEEEPAPAQPSMKERLKARIAEDAKKIPPGRPAPTAAAAAKPAAPAATPVDSAAAEPAKTDPVATAAPTRQTPPKPAPANAPAAKESPTVLPRVEVKKERITVLDQKIAEQEQAIAREKKNLKATEVDVALNDSKIARPMAIFGGESSQFRQRVASERVELMEAERDILEAMKRVRTKEEKAELQKQLDELRAVRRELEKSLR